MNARTREPVVIESRPTTQQDLVTLVTAVAATLGWKVRRLIPLRAGSALELVLIRRSRRILAVVVMSSAEVSLDQQALVSAWGPDGHVWTPEHLAAMRAVLA
jgi:hypothetical protein